MAAQDPWKLLGEMLEQRRVELDTRYRNLTLFAEERGIDYRLAWDAEHGARTNYRRPTLRAVEVAYGLPPNAIDSFLASAAAATGERPAELRYDDPAKDAIAADVWRVHCEEGYAFSIAEMRGAVVVRWAQRQRDTGERNGERRAAAG